MRLCNQGADVNAYDNRSRTAISLAASKGGLYVFEALLNAEPDLDRGDRFGRTPLSFAARNGHLWQVERLLRVGANPRIPDQWGYTTLSPATPYEKKDMVRILQKWESAHPEPKGLADSNGVMSRGVKRARSPTPFSG